MFRELKQGGRAVVCHNESREAINALHQRIAGDVQGDMLPHAPDMKDIFLGASGVEATIEVIASAAEAVKRGRGKHDLIRQ